MLAEEKMGDRGDEKAQAGSTLIQPEEKMGDGDDKKFKDNITKDRRVKRKWYMVHLVYFMDSDEQEAMLLEVLKCDKSELPSMYRHLDILSFEASLTLDEAIKLRDFGLDVMYFNRRDESKTSKRANYEIVIRRKKQKLNSGSNVGDSEEETVVLAVGDSDSDDGASPHRCECYMPFNESGIRWYKVHLENDKSSDEQVALLTEVLKRGRSEFLYIHHTEDLFEAALTEEEAKKVAGWRDVEHVEPRRYVWSLDV